MIVGAGSAGCVLAGRLSEDPDVSVLLLEAGGPDTAPEIHVPAMFPIMFKSNLDWDLTGDEEPGLDRRRLYLPRGRMIGGCSSINAMIYLRGNRADYDDWAANGADGWSYDEVLPYFKRGEDNERGESEYHGVGGPQAVSDSRSMHPLVDTMLEAAVQAGHPANDDLNGAQQDGVGRFQLTQRDGFRCSTADAYLHPALERPNLEVRDSVYVERIVFDGKRAVGVELVEPRAARDGPRRARGDRLRGRVPVAGAADALRHRARARSSQPFGIEVREELPVGRNLQDHAMANLNYISNVPALFGIYTPENFELLHEEGRGPLSSNLPEAGGFFRTRPDLAAPDMQFHFSPSLFYDEGLTAAARPRLRVRAGAREAGRARQGVAAHADGGLEAARALELPHDRGGSRGVRRRHAHGARGRRAARARRRWRRSRSASPRRTPRRTSSPGAARTASPSTTRRRRARSATSSTRSCASTASRDCASSTRR